LFEAVLELDQLRVLLRQRRYPFADFLFFAGDDLMCPFPWQLWAQMSGED
jgi:hypothetical protein